MTIDLVGVWELLQTGVAFAHRFLSRSPSLGPLFPGVQTVHELLVLSLAYLIARNVHRCDVVGIVPHQLVDPLLHLLVEILVFQHWNHERVVLAGLVSMLVLDYLG